MAIDQTKEAMKPDTLSCKIVPYVVSSVCPNFQIRQTEHVKPELWSRVKPQWDGAVCLFVFIGLSSLHRTLITKIKTGQTDVIIVRERKAFKAGLGVSLKLDNDQLIILICCRKHIGDNA